MEKIPQTYDPTALTRILQGMQKQIESLQPTKLRRIKSVAADAAQNLAVNEVGYVLGDTGQNFDLVVRGEDSRLYRISGQASAVSAISSSPAGVFVLKSGDTMTGLLILSGDPSAALGAATKQYADNAAKRFSALYGGIGNNRSLLVKETTDISKRFAVLFG